MNTRFNPNCADIVREVIAAFERAFPQRLRAAYILGSYADATEAPTSDLDLTFIFRDAFVDQQERDAAYDLARVCASRSAVELDIEVEDETALAHGARPSLKLASAHVFGDDIRERVPLVSLDMWTRDRMHSSWWRVARLFSRPAIVTRPLDYPEPNAPFFGYVRRTLRLPDGRNVPCTRDLIRLTGWAATALLALDRGVVVPSKRDAPTLYVARIGGEWARLISDTYTLCRLRWDYLVPDDPAERARLRALCEQTLRFERYFLARYLPYLLEELRGGGKRARAAATAMRLAPLAAPEVERALRKLAIEGDEATGQLARQALAACHVSQRAR